MNIQRILTAVDFALRAHGDQKRKYTGESYVTHTLEVAKIVADYGGTEDMVIAAILHDIVEDTEVSNQAITEAFGDKVGGYVGWLTKLSRPEYGNRAFRAEMDRNFIAQAPADAQTIKLADLVSNTRSIVEHDKKFAEIYLKEKELLLKVLTKGDTSLLEYAWSTYTQSVNKLKDSKVT